MERIQGKRLDFYAGRDVTDFYRADEADARFEKLELALRSCMFALTKQREAMHEWELTVDHAIEEAKRALALMAG